MRNEESQVNESENGGEWYEGECDDEGDGHGQVAVINSIEFFF